MTTFRRLRIRSSISRPGLAFVAGLLAAVLVIVSARYGRADPGRPPPVVRIGISDSVIGVPDILPSGLVRLRLVNRGSRPHRLVLTRMRPGQVAEGYLRGAERWLEGGDFARWGEDPGSPGLVMPGDSTDVIVRLVPGHYVGAFWRDGPDGSVRIRTKSRAAFEVLAPPTGLPEAARPEADLTVEMSRHAYHLSGPLTPGRHIVRVVNRGPQEHDFQVARLASGRTVSQAKAWLQGGMKGAAPLEFVGGLVALSPGDGGWAALTLKPGRYVLLCLVPDLSDRKPQYEHGMLKSVTVK